ncbi:MAG: AIR synthase related protein [bacterium]
MIREETAGLPEAGAGGRKVPGPSALAELVRELLNFPGIRRKEAIGPVLRALESVTDYGRTVVGPGDDAAVLRLEGTTGPYLLMAADSIVPALIEADPYRAGRAAVLVNANDIYAMGGRPLAMVNVLGGVVRERQAEICRGMADECRRLRVPMVGGHLAPEEGGAFLAVSVLGEARALLVDSRATPGQDVVLALDLRGERWGDAILNWDSHAGKGADTLLADLGVLCSLAERGLCSACRDVSNAGIVGTLAMLLERAGLGARIDLGSIAVPPPFGLGDWLRVYPSFGFVLVSAAAGLRETLRAFSDRGIWAARIGRTDGTGRLRVCLDGEEAVAFDFSVGRILNPCP